MPKSSGVKVSSGRAADVNASVDTGPAGITARGLGLTPEMMGVGKSTKSLSKPSPSVEEAARAAIAKIREALSRCMVSIMNGLPGHVKEQAYKDAKALQDPRTLKESQFRDGFLKRVNEEAASPGKHLSSRKGAAPIPAVDASGNENPDYAALMQKMFDAEILKYAQEAQKKSDAEDKKNAEEREKKAEKKAKELEVKGSELATKEHKAKKFYALSAGSEAVGVVGGIVALPGSALVGLAQFLNENAPDGHKGEFDLLLKLAMACQLLASFPTTIIKGILDSKAIENAPTKELADAYKAHLTAKPAELADKKAALEKANQSVLQKTGAERRAHQANVNASGGEIGTGSGAGGRDSQGRDIAS